MPEASFDTHELTNDTITTTTETVLATLAGVTTGRRSNVRLKGWAQVTTGANTTGLTARIRRGTDATGALIGEANVEQVEAAAGSTEGIEIEAVELGVDLSAATYVLTVQQAAATADGTGLQASLGARVTR